MISRRAFGKGVAALSMTRGDRLPGNRRPDQQYDPPSPLVAPGSNTGIFRGRLVIIKGGGPPGSGFYIYDAVSGNLLLSIAPAAGTGPEGGTVVPLLGVYGSHAGGALPTFTVDTSGNFLAAGQVELIWEDENNAPNAPAGIGGQSSTASSFLELFSGKATLAGQASNVQLLDSVLSGIVNGTIQLNAGQVWINGEIIIQGTVNAAPGGSGNAETWHNLGAMQNGWTVGGQAKYRLNAFGNLELSLVNVNPGTKTDGTVLWSAGTLPAAYRPSSTRTVTVRMAGTALAFATTSSPSIAIQSTGGIICEGLNTAGATLNSIEFNGDVPLV